MLYGEKQPIMRNRKCHQIIEVSFFLSKRATTCEIKLDTEDLCSLGNKQ